MTVQYSYLSRFLCRIETHGTCLAHNLRRTIGGMTKAEKALVFFRRARGETVETDGTEFEDLARNLRTAYLASHMGITLATAERRYSGKDEPPNQFWLLVARAVALDMAAAQSDALRILERARGPVQ